MNKRQNARKLNVSPSHFNQQRWKQEQLDVELILLGCTSFDFSFYFILSKRMRIHISHYLQTLSRHIIIICQRYEWKVWLPRFISWPMLTCLWFNTIQLIAITLFIRYILNESKRKVPKTFTKKWERRISFENFRFVFSLVVFSFFFGFLCRSRYLHCVYMKAIIWKDGNQRNKQRKNKMKSIGSEVQHSIENVIFSSILNLKKNANEWRTLNKLSQSSDTEWRTCFFLYWYINYSGIL